MCSMDCIQGVYPFLLMLLHVCPSSTVFVVCCASVFRKAVLSFVDTPRVYMVIY